MIRKMIVLSAIVLGLAGCGEKERKETLGYQQITAEEAKTMMNELDDEIILDVREIDEYCAGHILDAVLFPVDAIDEETAKEVIPAKDTVVLIYCRSGNRSKTASSTLAALGYTEIYEFGGIQDWPYETE